MDKHKTVVKIKVGYYFIIQNFPKKQNKKKQKQKTTLLCVCKNVRKDNDIFLNFN